MSVASEVGQEISQEFFEQTRKIFQQYRAQWVGELASWMNRVSQLDLLYKSYNKYGWLKGSSSDVKNPKGRSIMASYGAAMNKRSRTNLDSKMAEIYASDILEEKKISTIIHDIVENGYKLLNNIGESIRQEQLLYTIVITTTGEKISSMNGDVYSFTISGEKFLELIGHAGQELRVKQASGKFLRELEEASTFADKTTTKQKWDISKREMFVLYQNQVQNLKQHDWTEVNEGNLLEGFHRFGEWAKYSAYSEQSYWGGVYVSMRDTMANPDAFWQGGDIDNIQMKGLEASVTNLNSLIVAAKKALDILASGSEGQGLIKKYVNKNFINQFDNAINMAEDEIVEKLIGMFTGNIQGR